MKFKNRIIPGLLCISMLLCSCGHSSSSQSDSSASESSSQSVTSQQTTASDEQTAENTQTTASDNQTTTNIQTTAPNNQSGSVSQTSKDTETSAQKPIQKDAQGVPMWEGTAPNGSKITFLASFHAARSDFYPLQDKLKQAYDEAEIIAVECDAESAENEQMQFELQKKMTYSDGTLLKDKLSQEAYSILCRQLSEINASEDMVKNYKPWAAYETISALLILSSDIKTKNSIDYYIMEHTKTDGKQLYELENAQLQTDMITEQPDKLYDALFRLSKNQTKQSYLDETSKLYDAWLKGDLEQLTKMLALPSDEDLKKEGMSDEDITLLKARNKTQVDDRNIGMANKIKQLFKLGRKTLVTVGSAHYLGDKGIIALLEKEGYTFKRI